MALLLSAFCLLPSAFCLKAGAPSFAGRRSRVKLQASDAVETKSTLASANQRFEGARICRGSSICRLVLRWRGFTRNADAITSWSGQPLFVFGLLRQGIVWFSSV